MWLWIAVFAAIATLAPAENSDEAPLVAVYVIRGKTARLPCNITSPAKDSVVLVLWYKNGTKTPVYSVDSRNKPLSEGRSWTHEDVFGDRASFETSGGLSHLVVKGTKFEDEGLFRCRVDFRTNPTHIGRIDLHVVDPPRSIRLYATDGSVVGEKVSVMEGKPLAIACMATGGDPAPSIYWWSNGKRIAMKSSSDIREQIKHAARSDMVPKKFSDLNDIMPKSSDTVSLTKGVGRVYELIYPEKILSKEIARDGNISCTASNNPDIDPLSISVQLIQVEEAPISVEMLVPPSPLIGGKEYEVSCRAEGVQPSPTISWLLGGKVLTENVVTHRVSSSETHSVLRLKAGFADDRTRLECQAMSPSMPQIRDIHAITLHVNYVPEAKIRLTNPKSFPATVNKKISEENIDKGFSEGQSADFHCQTKANPPTYNITFLFNGRPLHQKLRAVTKGPKLTLLNLTHLDAGLYTCVASNFIGDGQSNAVGLHINYAPVCKKIKPQEIVALNGEVVKLVCDVVASPMWDVHFDWKVQTLQDTNWQMFDSSSLEHLDTDTVSRGSFVMTNSSENFIVKCWASNKVGSTKLPCVFDVKLVDVPGPLIGCKQDSVTSYSANITCSPGTTGGLMIQFHLKVQDVNSGKIISETVSQTPRFFVATLDPGRVYTFAFYAFHSKGKGESIVLMVKTLNPQAEEVVNPNLSDPPAAQNPSPVVPSHPIHTLFSVPLVVGIAAGIIVGLALVIAIIVRCKWRHIYHRNSQAEGKKASSGGMSSRESLLDLRDPSTYHSCSPNEKKEVLASFSAETVVVSEILTSSFASLSSSPVPISSTPVTISSCRSTTSVSPRLNKVRRSLRFKDTDSVIRLDPDIQLRLEKVSKTSTCCESENVNSNSDELSEALTRKSCINLDRKYSSDGPDQVSKAPEGILIKEGRKLGGSVDAYFSTTCVNGLSPTMLASAPPPVYYNPPVVFHQQPRLVSPSNLDPFAQHSPTIRLSPQFGTVRPPPPPRAGSFLSGSSEMSVPPPSTFSSLHQSHLINYTSTLPRSNPNFSNQGLGWRVENLRKMELIRLQHHKDRESGTESGTESVRDGENLEDNEADRPS